jgi:Calcineurin-like phosphoesterase
MRGHRMLALCLATLAVSLAAADAGNAALTDPAPAVLVGAGDIASCSSAGDEATAKLVDQIPGTVFTVGDNAYDKGTAGDFTQCYEPTWGRFKSRTKPAAGNHEYQTPGATPYYDYFGAAAGDRTQGWYSYEAGAWHVVVLNSNCGQVGGCSPGSPQERWLRADLTAAKADCIAAVWHEPRFSSVYTGSTSTKPFWNVLYQFGADVILNGHHHAYERFAPQDPDGKADPKGIREFIVGMGGRSLASSFQIAVPNSEVRNNNTYGVMKLTLRADSYDWEFVPVAGKTFGDSGSSGCKGNGPPDPGPSNSTVFAAAADAQVAKGKPTASFGSAVTMTADASPVLSCLVRFDVSGLTGTVTNAKLRLYAGNGSPDGPSLYPTGPDWQETAVTWDSRPARIGPAAADLGKVKTGTWVEYDVTSLVTGNGRQSFELPSVSTDGTGFATKEAGANGPQLVVTTAPPPTTSTSTSTTSTTSTTTTSTTEIVLPEPEPGAPPQPPADIQATG